MYRAGLESILGFQLRGSRLKIDPCVPRWWREFEIQYRHGATRYHIKVENPQGVCRGIAALEVDGVAQSADDIPLTDDGAKHSVRVVLGDRKHAPDAERAAESGRASLLKE
jgi:cyclic beta-1,2-glucan synthetase